jgi:hypothetical protein
MPYGKWKTNRWRGAAFCVHCGNDTKISIVLEQPWVETTLMLHGRKTRDDYFVWMLSVARCSSCNGILVHQTGWDQYGEAFRAKVLGLEYLVWPHEGALCYPTPEHIRQMYAEALTIKTRSPHAFAVQIRRTLESVCEDRGKSGTLHSMLMALKESGEIPATLAAIADVVRITGNSGAHSGTAVTAFQAAEIDEFFRSIVEYIYAAPRALELFEESRRASRPTGRRKQRKRSPRTAG